MSAGEFDTRARAGRVAWCRRHIDECGTLGSARCRGRVLRRRRGRSELAVVEYLRDAPCGRPEIRSTSTMWMVATGCETCSGARSSAVIDGVCRTLPTVTVCGVRSGSRAAWKRALRWIRRPSGAPGIDHLLGQVERSSRRVRSRCEGVTLARGTAAWPWRVAHGSGRLSRVTTPTLVRLVAGGDGGGVASVDTVVEPGRATHRGTSVRVAG